MADTFLMDAVPLKAEKTSSKRCLPSLRKKGCTFTKVTPSPYLSLNAEDKDTIKQLQSRSLGYAATNDGSAANETKMV